MEFRRQQSKEHEASIKRYAGHGIKNRLSQKFKLCSVSGRKFSERSGEATGAQSKKKRFQEFMFIELN